MPPPAPAPAAPTGLIANRDADAAAGRAFLTPTAITGRKGSVRVDTWFPTLPIAGLAVASYSVTNRLEIGAGGMWMIDAGEESLAAIRIKFAALRAKRGGIAVEYQHIFTDDELISVLSVVGSHCVDAGCRTLLSLHVTAVPEYATYVDDNDTFGDALHVFGGASIVTGGKVKFVADLLTIEDSGERLLAGYAGVRLNRPRWALDAGLVAGGEDGDFEALPVPLVAASARW